MSSLNVILENRDSIFKESSCESLFAKYSNMKLRCLLLLFKATSCRVQNNTVQRKIYCKRKRRDLFSSSFFLHSLSLLPCLSSLLLSLLSLLIFSFSSHSDHFPFTNVFSLFSLFICLFLSSTSLPPILLLSYFPTQVLSLRTLILSISKIFLQEQHQFRPQIPQRYSKSGLYLP